MATDPPPWFKLDGDLWQTENKLPWPARKVAVYLRAASGPWQAEGEEAIPHVALRSLERIAAETGISEDAARKALARLCSWPSCQEPFITQADYDNGIYILRPVPDRRWIRAYRWLLGSRLTDDIKDVLLFVRSRFTGKTKAGEELFDCNLYGERQPSIRRCCYLQGSQSKARSARVKGVVSELQRLGLMVEVRRAGRNRAMVVRLCDKTPAGVVVEAAPEEEGNGRQPGRVTAKREGGNGRTRGGVTAERSPGNDTPESVPQSHPDSVVTKSSPESPAGREDSSSSGEAGGCEKAVEGAAPPPGVAAPATRERPRKTPSLASAGPQQLQQDLPPPAQPEAQDRPTESQPDAPNPAAELAATRATTRQLDSLLAVIRNPQEETERRLKLAVAFQKRVEDLAPAYQIRFKTPRLRKLGLFLEAIEALPPEVTTDDLIWALDMLENYDEPCWPVALEENTWSQIVVAAGRTAGIRLAREEGLVSWRCDSALQAVRDYRAGRIGRDGYPILSERGRTKPEGGQTSAGEASADDALHATIDQWMEECAREE